MNKTLWQVIPVLHKKNYRLKKERPGNKKSKNLPILNISHLHPRYRKEPDFSFGMPVSKMDILRQSVLKQISLQFTSNKLHYNFGQPIQQSLQIHQNPQKYWQLNELCKTNPLEERLPENSTTKQNRLT